MRRNKRANRIPTAERLAEALHQANAPEWMIEKAQDGYYDDYRSSVPFNISALVGDARAEGLHDIAKRAIEGEFDGQKWESDAWARSSEGRDTFRSLLRETSG